MADYVGDSLGLSRQAAAADQQTIVFCGVHFMAETASVLCPEQDRPDPRSGCRVLAGGDSSTPSNCARGRQEHPGRGRGHVREHHRGGQGADRLLLHLLQRGRGCAPHLRARGPDTEILFGPDMWLGAYVEKQMGKPMHVWDGECHVHAGIRPADIETHARGPPRGRLPDPPRVRLHDKRDGVRRRRGRRPCGVQMLSTGGMLEYAEPRRGPPGPEAIVATEIGMLYPLQMAAPDVDLHPRQPGGELQVHEDDHAAEAAGILREQQVRGQGARGDRAPARVPIDRMVAIG